MPRILALLSLVTLALAQLDMSGSSTPATSETDLAVSVVPVSSTAVVPAVVPAVESTTTESVTSAVVSATAPAVIMPITTPVVTAEPAADTASVALNASSHATATSVVVVAPVIITTATTTPTPFPSSHVASDVTITKTSSALHATDPHAGMNITHANDTHPVTAGASSQVFPIGGVLAVLAATAALLY